MDGTLEVLSQRDAARAGIVGYSHVGKQVLGVVGRYGACVQMAVALIIVVGEGQECPGVLLDGVGRDIVIATYGGHELVVSVDAQFELLVAVAVGEDVTGFGHTYPHISREALLGQVEAGLCVGSALGALCRQSHVVLQLVAVEHTTDDDVVLRQHLLLDVLVEGHADFVTAVQHAVARAGSAEELRTLQVFHQRQHVALSGHRFAGVDRRTLCTELVSTVSPFSFPHVYRQFDDTIFGQQLLTVVCADALARDIAL